MHVNVVTVIVLVRTFSLKFRRCAPEVVGMGKKAHFWV